MSKRIAQSVSLTPELDRFVQDQVASGRYQTFSEVVRDALRLLQERASARPGASGASVAGGDDGR